MDEECCRLCGEVVDDGGAVLVPTETQEKVERGPFLNAKTNRTIATCWTI